ncbi:branched-chain amino acid ABC transporter permease [Neorhizobium tomejilense]|uniref:branched-chain amino acid ABC transporter permease n=1 Tax=Neorhizobium tomejilense TaxID=2093828 RepID=UPI003ED163F5
MNATVAVLLAQDALINAAIYALLALTLVMVFSVTRVILLPQGEIVSLAALTLAAMETGVVPGTIYLLCAGGGACALLELWTFVRTRQTMALRSAAGYVLYAALVTAATLLVVPAASAAPIRILLSILIVAPFGLFMYRIAFRPLAHASVLVLLIVAMAIHFVMLGFGLMAFGAEGVRTEPIVSGTLRMAGFVLKTQALFVIAVTIVLIGIMAWFFGRTLAGKALRATAYNRTGARLVGIRPQSSGGLAFILAGVIGTASGLLIAPVTTVYFDTGFLIGLKGFIAAIVGGLGSYPLAALGAVLIGIIESYSSFWASAFKDSIVFALIIPVLLWRNIGHALFSEEEEE